MALPRSVGIVHEPWALINLDDLSEDIFVEPSDVHLAAALCTLPFIHFEVLRDVRRFLYPDSSTITEQRFCASSLIKGRAIDGFSLNMHFCHIIRDRLRSVVSEHRQQQEAVDHLRTILNQHSYRLSPLLAIEERLTWEWLTLEQNEFRQIADQRLRNIMFTAQMENRGKIFRWASAAAQRLPANCFDSDIGWILSQMCAARKIPFPRIKPPVDCSNSGIPESWYRRQRLLGIYRDGEHLEYGSVDARRHVAIRVADTEPMVLNVTIHQGNNKTTHVETWSKHDEPKKLRTNGNALSIRDSYGNIYDLRAFADGDAPEIVEARTTLQSAFTHLEHYIPVRYRVLNPLRIPNNYKVSLIDLGCDAVLYLPHPVASNAEGVGVITSLKKETRSIRIDRYKPKLARLERGGLNVSPGDRSMATIIKVGSIQFPNNNVHGQRSVRVELEKNDPLCFVTKNGSGRFSFSNAAVNTGTHWKPELGSIASVLVVKVTDDYIDVLLDLSVATNVTPQVDLLQQYDPSFLPKFEVENFRKKSGRSNYQNVALWLEEETLQEGMTLELEVVKVVNFGVFLLLPDGRNGLAHNSNLQPPVPEGQRSTHQAGDRLHVEILSIDRERRRIELAERTNNT